MIADAGFSHKEKAADPGRFVVSKTGVPDVEVFELAGHVQIVYDPVGRYPAQISTEYW